MPSGDALLVVDNLKKYFRVTKGVMARRTYIVRAVDGVSFSIPRGRTLGLVGESGSGKTTVGLTVLRVYRPDGGRIVFDGVDITYMPERRLRRLRRYMNIVFQNPYSSLNPRMTVFDAVAEPVRILGLVRDREELRETVYRVLEDVGLSPAPDYASRYPHELSGGQRQRVAIARAIVTRPKFVVLDEPTSNLDVSVQAQILNLLRDLQAKYGLTYLFISHDLGVVRYMSDYIAVMYAGKIVEYGEKRRVLENPLHPYTRMLLASVPAPDPSRRKLLRVRVEGEPPSPLNPPPGCRFHPRCPEAGERCRREEPPLVEAERNHYVACWLYVKG